MKRQLNISDNVIDNLECHTNLLLFEKRKATVNAVGD